MMKNIEDQLVRSERQIEQLIRIVAHMNERVVHLEKLQDNRFRHDPGTLNLVVKR
ncbi:hypothetical protein [Edaphobacillus lindanitolerans]|uniref:Uncharacterized protein n=1 Tax=Edaphobacillus lindanitolerans TaxID=550447 RepID=A0A1U7PM79_9BACI|nr:hypothetical protein [Edaphobacillus lindanitolerans]SIT69386.1 hypothetical protein SAMN05428946_0482 [Edaphobacillus lindanitolerans]